MRMGRLSGSRILMRVICGLLALSCSVIIAPPSVLARTDPPASFWIDFRESGGEPGFPVFETLETGITSIVLKGTFPGAWAELKATDKGEFTSFNLEPYGRPTETGLPALPVFRELIKIPYQTGTRLEVISAVYTDFLLSELKLPPPMPLQPSQPKTKAFDVSDGFEIDWGFYTSGSLYPAEPVQTGEAFVMRENAMQFIAFNPVAYNPSAQMLRLYSEITVKVKYEEGGYERSAELSVEKFALEGTKEAAEVEGIGYLIISHQDFFEAMEPFVELKESQGFSVTMRSVPTPVSIQSIKSVIKQEYEKPDQNLGYLLLVGDVDKIPACLGDKSEAATDLCYAVIDNTTGETDWHPVIGKGRFPVSNVNEVNWLVNKYLAYENLQGSEDWLRKATFIATSDLSYDEFVEETHNYIIDTFTTKRDYWGIFPTNPQSGGDKIYYVEYHGRGENIISAVNDGRSFLVYSGHGNNFSWDDFGLIDPDFDLDMDFDKEEIITLSTNGKTPFIMSHACLTGNFSAESGRSLGEEWILQQNKGAIAFWGATNLTYWYEDEVLEKAAFTSYFTSPQGSVTLSEMTDYALMEVEAFNPVRAQYYWEIYNILGDPALVVRGSPVRVRVYLPLVTK